MKTNTRLLAVGIAAAFTSYLAHGQSSDDDIETISVIGSRTDIQRQQLAATSTVIGAEQIKQSGAYSLTQLLRTLGGVSISQSGSQGSLTEIRLRGSESNHLLVLVDGVAINDLGQGGLIDLAHLNLENVERVELLRGPQASLWGSGAVAGVLSITTKQANGNNTGSLKMELGENASIRYAGDRQGKIGQANYAFAVSHFSTDGENISRDGNEEDGYRNSQVSGKLNWRISDVSRLVSHAQLTDYRNDFDATDFIVTGLPIDADNSTDGQRTNAKLEWHFTPTGFSWQQIFGVQYNENDAKNIVDGSFNSRTSSDTQRWYWLTAFDYQQDARLNVLAEYTYENFEQQGLATGFGDPNQSQKNETTSLALDWLHQLDSVALTASTRFDNNSEFDDANTYRLGASWQISQGYRVFASFGKAVKNPTFIERFGFFPASFVGNEDLKPESSKTLELGGEFSLVEDWVANVSLFDSELSDEINGFVFDANTGAFTAENVNGESERTGIETRLTGSIGDIGLTLDAAYIQSEQPGFNGDLQEELRRPEWSAGVTANYAFADDNANLYLQLAYQGERLDEFFPPFPQPSQRLELGSYTLLNLSFTYQIDPEWQLGVRADNLLDKGYEDVIGFVGQGRALYLNLTNNW